MLRSRGYSEKRSLDCGTEVSHSSKPVIDSEAAHFLEALWPEMNCDRLCFGKESTSLTLCLHVFAGRSL